jgi:hypothetical protein
MPTENRSSNTEMVCVPREVIEFATGLKWHGYKSGTDQKDDRLHALNKLRAILEAPAPQHQGEPVAYQIRSKTNRAGSQWTPWRECCDTTRAMHSHEVGRFNQFGIMREIRPVYTHVDPAEIERLREELRVEKAKGVLLDDARINAEEAQWAAERKLAERDALLDRLRNHLIAKGVLGKFGPELFQILNIEAPKRAPLVKS